MRHTNKPKSVSVFGSASDCMAQQVKNQNEVNRNVITDMRRGFSDVFAHPCNTVISGGTDEIRNAATAVMTRAYGKGRPIIFFHCGNRELMKKLTGSKFAAEAGGVVEFPLDPFGSAISRQRKSDLILKRSNSEENADSEACGALDFIFDFLEKTFGEITLLNLRRTVERGPASLLIELLNRGLITEDEFNETCEKTEDFIKSVPLIKSNIIRLAEVFGITKKTENLLTLDDIMSENRIFAVDLKNLSAHGEIRLNFLIEALTNILDVSERENVPLVVFGSVPTKYSNIVSKFISVNSGCAIKIISSPDIAADAGESDILNPIFSTAYNKIILMHGGQSASTISERMGVYTKLVLTVGTGEGKESLSLSTSVNNSLSVTPMHNYPRVEAGEISALSGAEAFISVGGSSEIVRTYLASK